MELASHGISKTPALELGEAQGTSADLAMGLNGVMTATALPLLMTWIFC
jgi:putative effector of murein hydrolase